MTARTALLVALALVPACKKEGSPSAAPEKGSAGPALEPGAKPQPSEAAPEGTTPPAKPAEATPAQVWDKFTSKDGGFTIELPGKAEERDQGGVKMVGAEFGATASDPRTSMCGAAYVKLPAVENVKTTLEAAVAKHKENATTVVEDKEITLGKVPGRSLIVQNASHRKWMRVYLEDKTLYIINCGGPFDRADTDGPLALKAVGSFALTK